MQCSYWNAMYFSGGQKVDLFLKMLYIVQSNKLQVIGPSSVLKALKILLQKLWKHLTSGSVPNCFWDDLMACVGRSWRMAPDYWNYFSACAGRLCKAGGWLLELFLGPKPAFPVPTTIMEPEAWVRISYETATNESSLVGFASNRSIGHNAAAVAQHCN